VELFDGNTSAQEALLHRNAPLTPEGRLRLCARIESGWTVTAAAESMQISRQCAHKWWSRYLAGGREALVDRSSRPHSSPNQTPARTERRIVALRRSRMIGPARLAGIVGVPASTVHRVLVRHGVNRLRWLDRPTGRTIRRIETSAPGELVHIDVKKLAKVPPGGGHRLLGREARTGSVAKRGLGYTHIHTAIDAYSRLAYSEFAGIENTVNCVAFLDRAIAWFAARGVTVERILTDNGNGYRSLAWRDRCRELGIGHTRTRPYRPATNGKVERFNRTLVDEWAYARLWRSEASRARALDRWLHIYNHHRHHTAIGGPPTSRVNNLPSYNT
jgi:transposase InsO family protein